MLRCCGVAAEHFDDAGAGRSARKILPPPLPPPYLANEIDKN